MLHILEGLIAFLLILIGGVYPLVVIIMTEEYIYRRSKLRKEQTESNNAIDVSNTADIEPLD